MTHTPELSSSSADQLPLQQPNVEELLSSAQEYIHALTGEMIQAVSAEITPEVIESNMRMLRQSQQAIEQELRGGLLAGLDVLRSELGTLQGQLDTRNIRVESTWLNAKKMNQGYGKIWSIDNYISDAEKVRLSNELTEAIQTVTEEGKTIAEEIVEITEKYKAAAKKRDTSQVRADTLYRQHDEIGGIMDRLARRLEHMTTGSYDPLAESLRKAQENLREQLADLQKERKGLDAKWDQRQQGLVGIEESREQFHNRWNAVMRELAQGPTEAEGLFGFLEERDEILAGFEGLNASEKVLIGQKKDLNKEEQVLGNAFLALGKQQQEIGQQQLEQGF